MPELRCPYCLAALLGPSSQDAVVACAACGTEHHQACFLEHGRCTVLGCRAARFRADPGAARVVGSLHPFLPVGGRQRLRRSLGFLSVQPPQVERGRRRDLALRLVLPPVADASRGLEGTLVVEAPEPVRGQGLRLRVETLLETPDGPSTLRVEEAALVGGAARSWLERLRAWSGPRRGLLLARGRTTFRFTLHPAPLRWRGQVPGEGLGPRQTLVVTAELDALPGVRSAPVVMPLVDGRPAPPALQTPPALHTVEAPALALDEPAAWTACPVRATRQPAPCAAVPAALAAVQRRRVRRGPRPRVDAIDLRVAPLAPGPPVVRGEVLLALHARALVGTLVVSVVTDRRRPSDRDWHVFAREEVVLAGPSAPGQDVSGRHVLTFEVVPGPALRARGRDRRRLRLQATLLFAGLPLRSREVEVALAPRRRVSRGAGRGPSPAASRRAPPPG
ncbi:MAG: hypothetical protein M9894_29020 [Planctomycetes bacterium]|nr:hypothetical protein [Planctomycetota bacterium]